MAFEYLSEAILRLIPLSITQNILLFLWASSAWKDMFNFLFPNTCKPLLLSSLRKESKKLGSSKVAFANKVYLNKGTSCSGIV